MSPIRLSEQLQRWRPFAGYLVAAGGVAVVTAVIGAVLSRIGIANISLLYLLVVLPIAVRYGFWPAVSASVLAFLTYNRFHIQPVHTWTIARPEELVALVLSLVVSVVTSQLAAAQRRRANEAQRREREAVALGELSQILNASDDLDATLSVVAGHLRAALALAGCAIFLPERGSAGGRVTVRAASGIAPLPGELAAAPWIAPAKPLDGMGGARAGHWIRIRTPESPAMSRRAHRVQFVPLTAGEQTVGMLRLAAAPERPPWTPEERRLIAVAAAQIGRTVERARLRQEATDAEVLRKTEDVRQAVLAAVSHDLRTPLASIQASAESLAQPAVQWNDEERASFAAAIVQEAGRMARLVENLLDMSRIEVGRLRPERGWYPLETLVDDVLARLEPITGQHQMVTDVPDTLPPVPLDYTQIGEVLANLVENAVNYTPPGSTIRISAAQGNGTVRVAVQDDGPGIAVEALPHVFEKFYRVTGGDRARTKGSGLGLAIARGFIEAHGGTIEAQSPPPGEPQGTVFTFRLPLRPAGLDAANAPATPFPGAAGQMPAVEAAR